MKTDKHERVQRALISWYGRTRRELPWRQTRDPYAIWIAETMLQQTQVKTVLPYYRRFLKAFPCVGALDRARRDAVLAHWSGLGYYRRAINLKRAAATIVNVHGGKLPRDFHALRALPGIGDYTAGALMSIAFDEPYPALDGNARRVLARLFDIDTEKSVRQAAARLARISRPGDLNQALMDLGATVCLPREPRCPRCPVASRCSTLRRGTIHKRAAPKLATRKIDWPLALIEKNGKILLRRRPSGGILPGLWEIPGGERKNKETLQAALRRNLDGLGRRVKLQSAMGVIRHSITNRRIRAPVFRCACAGGAAFPARNWRWFRLSSLHRHPLSSLSLKAAKLLAPS
ncbi:MAG TPA: A/G-specific adenine glycosylase [Candidatus Binatia bacterium]